MKKIVVLALALVAAATPVSAQTQTWPTFNGDLKAQKFSNETSITPANVNKLTEAWQMHTGDVSDGSGGKPKSVWSATPLFVNNTLYLGTPFYRIFALEPDTGKVKWTYDTHGVLKGLTQPELKSRGVAYWQADTSQADQPCQKIVYIGTMDAKLHAVDADTGKICAGFAKGGILDIDQWNKPNAQMAPVDPATADRLQEHSLHRLGRQGLGQQGSARRHGLCGGRAERQAQVDLQRAARGGSPSTGTANVWASMSVDPEAGLLYVPISSPSPNFFGGNRTEDLPLATSIAALDTETGKVVWSRQLVHHDLWDYDTNSPPVLIDLKKDGQAIPALVQSSKQGFLYVLNRKTGEPIYPIEEKPVPKSDLPGEQASPTQPYVATPTPVVQAQWPGVSRLADIASLGYCSRTAKSLRYDGKFTPPSLQGSLVYPGNGRRRRMGRRRRGRGHRHLCGQ